MVLDLGNVRTGDQARASLCRLVWRHSVGMSSESLSTMVNASLFRRAI